MILTKNQVDQLERHADWVARRLYVRSLSGMHMGIMDPPALAYLDYCHFDSALTRTRVIFTRDSGHHLSGWFKNPEFERCWHLSLSAFPDNVQTDGHLLETHQPATQRLFLRAFFKGDAPKTWLESAKTPEGQRLGVVHFRLFADPRWVPIHPRGEVYTREFTELGWKSASELGNVIESPLVPG